MDMAQAATKQDVEDIVTRVVKKGFADFGEVLSGAIQMISDRFDQVDERFDKVEGDIADLKADVADLKVDVADLKVDVADLKTDVSDLSTVTMRIDNRLDKVVENNKARDAKLRLIQRKIA
jgi:archaellum component FlaC